MVTIKGNIIVPARDLDAVCKALLEHERLTRAEPGCLSFSVTQREDDPCVFDVAEAFVDQAAFKAHQARIKGTTWEAVTRNVERHYTID